MPYRDDSLPPNSDVQMSGLYGASYLLWSCAQWNHHLGGNILHRLPPPSPWRFTRDNTAPIIKIRHYSKQQK